jgi:general stress protein CsbA
MCAKFILWWRASLEKKYFRKNFIIIIIIIKLTLNKILIVKLALLPKKNHTKNGCSHVTQWHHE